LLDAQTMARRPLIPRSTVSLPYHQVIFCRFDATTLANLKAADKGPGTAKMHIRARAAPAA
jgi:hypothetical protein